jgi:peptide/nickel transport system permease protein
MTGYIIRRLINLILVMFLVGVFTFILIRVVPGDPAAVMAGPWASDEAVQQIRVSLGMDRPLVVQFFDWLWGILRGDFGESYFYGESTFSVIRRSWPVSIYLTVGGLLVAVGIGIPLGIVSAVRKGSLGDSAIRVLIVIGVSVPSFWLGLNAIYLFSVKLHVLPSGGFIPLSQNLAASLRSMLMPCFALGFIESAFISRMTRSSMLDVMRQEYITVAEAKGLKQRVVIFKHALRNALIPIVTIVGMSAGLLLGGSVIIETVFTLPGLGRLAVSAIQQRDYSIVQGVLIFYALLRAFVNLVVDISYAFLDPRIRYE